MIKILERLKQLALSRQERHYVLNQSKSVTDFAKGDTYNESVNTRNETDFSESITRSTSNRSYMYVRVISRCKKHELPKRCLTPGIKASQRGKNCTQAFVLLFLIPRRAAGGGYRNDLHPFVCPSVYLSVGVCVCL